MYAPNPSFPHKPRRHPSPAATRLLNASVAVIGVGSVGRLVAGQLATLGVPRMTLIDDGHVGHNNLSAEGFSPDEVGRLKVVATGDRCHYLRPDMEIDAISMRFDHESMKLLLAVAPSAIFVNVSDGNTRRLAWNYARQHHCFIGDVRIAEDVIHVLASAGADGAVDIDVDDSVFSVAESAFLDASPVYTSAIGAGLVIAQFVRWLRDRPVIASQIFDLRKTTLKVVERQSAVPSGTDKKVTDNGGPLS